MSESTASTFPLWTKFICTIGPASSNLEVLEGLGLAGASYIRNNFSHCQYDEYKERQGLVREINERHGLNMLMHADLQGPNIRVGKFEGGGIQIEAGQEYHFYTAAGQPEQPTDIFINDTTLHLDVLEGQPITFMDGGLEGVITKVAGTRISARMRNGGFLKDRKSINVPDTILAHSSAITEKDWQDLDFLIEAGVDVLALSFISGRKEIDEVRAKIGNRPIKIISKIERREAIKNIIEIIEASDGIMIARGDLGIEMPMEEIPVLQRSIINLCAEMNKPVIVATQMLLSMTENLRPTRAEVSDVANAVFSRADAVMLSEETAAGKDPVNALQTMAKIVRRAEEYMYHRPNSFDK